MHPLFCGLNLLFLVTLTGTPLLAADPSIPSSSKTSRDDALLDELANDPSGPALEKPDGRSDSKNRSPKRDKSPEASDQQLLEGLQDGEDIGQPPADPLQQIAQQMQQSRDRIARRDTSQVTQQLQQQISQEIHDLIKQAQKRGNQGSSSNSNAGGIGGSQEGPDGGNPMTSQITDSTERVERGREIEKDTVDVKDMLRRVWGHLPDKVREQMQNSLDEHFLPKYEKLIEDYYQRLAEQSGDVP